MKPPQFAIIGQPNVGKSTLFNTLSRRSIAIIDRVAGTTRDRLSAIVNLTPAQNQLIELIDTGGLVEVDRTAKQMGREPLSQSIQKQVKLAIQEADALIFMVDIRQGFNQEISG